MQITRAIQSISLLFFILTVLGACSVKTSEDADSSVDAKAAALSYAIGLELGDEAAKAASDAALDVIARGLVTNRKVKYMDAITKAVLAVYSDSDKAKRVLANAFSDILKVDNAHDYVADSAVAYFTQKEQKVSKVDASRVSVDAKVDSEEVVVIVISPSPTSTPAPSASASPSATPDPVEEISSIEDQYKEYADNFNKIKNNFADFAKIAANYEDFLKEQGTDYNSAVFNTIKAGKNACINAYKNNANYFIDVLKAEDKADGVLDEVDVKVLDAADIADKAEFAAAAD